MYQGQKVTAPTSTAEGGEVAGYLSGMMWQLYNWLNFYRLNLVLVNLLLEIIK